MRFRVSTTSITIAIYSATGESEKGALILNFKKPEFKDDALK